MTTERVLTLCVGISGYARQLLEPGEQPLQYLGPGARQLSEIFARAWGVEGSRHVDVSDADATRSRVTAALDADDRSYDLFVLYLAGHGRLRNDDFQFLFAADAAGGHLASSADVDGILQLVKAKHTLLFLDACHSGRYIEKSDFFRAVGTGRTRICLASSLPDQRSWEDSFFKRSLFAEALMNAMTVPSGAATSSAASKRIETAFDEISAEVVRHAFALKGSARQEPAMGGALTVPLWIPVTERQASARTAMTTYQTLLRRSRQIAAVTACLAVVAACAVSAAIWRPAVNGSGLVEIRPGPKWLSPLNIGPWRLRVETEASISDLKDEKDYPSVRAEIRDEEGMHAWPGRGNSNVRRWADYLVDEQLNAETAARWRVRLGNADAVDKLKAPGHILSSLVSIPLTSATKLAAEAKALAPSVELSDIWTIQWKQTLAPGSCDGPIPPERKDQLSFYLSSESTDIVAWLKGVALTARVDPTVDLDRVVSLVKMFSSANRLWKDQYAATLGAPGEPVTGASISARFNERPTPAEVSALAAVATAVVEQRTDRKVATVSPSEKAGLVGLMTGCAEVGVHALAAVGAGGDPARVVEWAHGRKRADQGRIPLLLLASRGALPPSEITQVLTTGGFGGDPADRKRAFVYAREWLTSISEVAGLPPGLLHGIIEYVEQRRAAGDDTAARDGEILLARSFGSLAADDRVRVVAMLTPPEGSLTSPLTGEPTFEKLGLLASTGTKLTPPQRAILMGIVQSSSPGEPSRISFVDADRNGREDVVQLVPGLTSTHLLAFSRMVVADARQGGVSIDPRTIPFLEQAIADGIRSGVRPALLRRVVTAAATAHEAAYEALDAGKIVTRLRADSDDAAKRFTTSAVAIAQLGAYPPERRAAVLNGLRQVWSVETEPEIKLSLASTIVGIISPTDALPRPNR
jgi:Caspase domain